MSLPDLIGQSRKKDWIIRSSRIMTNIGTGFAMNNSKMVQRKLLKFILSYLGIAFWFLLSFSAFNAYADIIIDNGNPGTTYTGSWPVSGGTTPYGTNSVWSRNGDTYSWQMSSQPAGVYEVYMWWSGYSSRGPNISVAINHANGTQTVNINQQQNEI